jgi:hypothetical protein
MFKNKLFGFLIVLAIVAAITIALFWRELVDAATEGVSSAWSTSVAQSPMVDADFSRIKEVRFESEHNNIAQIQVDALKIVGRTESAVTISVRIASASSGNDFPGLRVAVLSGSGAKLRTVEFGSTEYTHGDVFKSETVELPMQIKSGDASFTVSAFYKD